MTAPGVGQRLGGKRVRLYFIGYIASAVGNGLVLPLTVLYLDGARHLSAGQLSLYFATLSATALVSTPVAGHLVDRLGSRPMALTAMIGQAAGWIALSLSSSEPLALYGCAALIGAANSLFFSSQLAFLEQLFGQEELPRIFANQYRIANLILIAPILASGFLVETLGSGFFRWFILANGLSFLVFAAVLASLSRGLSVSQDQEHAAALRVDGNVFTPYRDPRFVPVLLVQLCAVAFAMAQVDTVVPVLLQRSTKDAVAVTAVLLASNSVTVVVLGGRIRKLVERYGEPRSLAAAFLLFALSVPLLAGCLRVQDAMQLYAIVAAYGIFFAIPEALVAPTLKPLAARLSPPGLKGRYGAAMSMVYSVATLVGPPLSFGLMDKGEKMPLLLMLVGMALGFSACVVINRMDKAGAGTALAHGAGQAH